MQWHCLCRFEVQNLTRQNFVAPLAGSGMSCKAATASACHQDKLERQQNKTNIHYGNDY